MVVIGFNFCSAYVGLLKVMPACSKCSPVITPRRGGGSRFESSKAEELYQKHRESSVSGDSKFCQTSVTALSAISIGT
jgi:hypothetical protein